MTNAPHLLTKSREGYKYGDVTMRDHMAYDGLWDAFTDQAMGALTEQANTGEQAFTREEQDEFARPQPPARREGLEGRPLRRRGRRRCRSRSARATRSSSSRTRASGPTRPPSRSRAAPRLQQGRHHHRRVRLADLRRRRRGRRHEQGEGGGARPDLARRDRRARRRRRPGLHAPAAAGACHRQGAARRRASTPTDLDLVEINEAFAAVGLASARELGIDLEKVNVNGGAIALGHPIGMSGARIVLHLALELQRRGGGVGAAALCGGGGQGDALIVRVPKRLIAAPTSLPEQGDFTQLSTCPPWSTRPGQGSPAPSRASSPSSRTATPPCARSWPPSRRTPGGVGHRPHRSPGVGKSTSTTALVGAFRERGLRVGVLAVDPSSPFSGGALLGDRVRMQDHALDPEVYIRSMAIRGHLGGLSWTTPQAIRVLDAAGCQVILVETVGVGQSRGRDRRAWPTRRSCCWHRGWGTASRRPRPGSSRSATSSSSTRRTGTAPMRRCATCGT